MPATISCCDKREEHSHLHNAVDDPGEGVEREDQDIEERETREDLQGEQGALGSQIEPEKGISLRLEEF